MTEDPKVILARMIAAIDLMDDLIRDMQRTLNTIPGDPLVAERALRISAANNHVARHGGSVADWEKCDAPSCVDARSALHNSHRDEHGHDEKKAAQGS